MLLKVSMADLFFLALIGVFFLLSLGLVTVFRRWMGA
jgi:hypothetical protein